MITVYVQKIKIQQDNFSSRDVYFCKSELVYVYYPLKTQPYKCVGHEILIKHKLHFKVMVDLAAQFGIYVITAIRCLFTHKPQKLQKTPNNRVFTPSVLSRVTKIYHLHV